MLTTLITKKPLQVTKTLDRVNYWCEANDLPRYWNGVSGQSIKFHEDFRAEGFGMTWVRWRSFYITFYVKHLTTNKSKRFAVSADKIDSIETEE